MLFIQSVLYKRTLRLSVLYKHLLRKSVWYKKNAILDKAVHTSAYFSQHWYRNYYIRPSTTVSIFSAVPFNASSGNTDQTISSITRHDQSTGPAINAFSVRPWPMLLDPFTYRPAVGTPRPFRGKYPKARKWSSYYDWLTCGHLRVAYILSDIFKSESNFKHIHAHTALLFWGI